MLNSEINIIRKAIASLSKTQDRFEDIQDLKYEGIGVDINTEMVMEIQDEVDHALILLKILLVE